MLHKTTFIACALAASLALAGTAFAASYGHSSAESATISYTLALAGASGTESLNLNSFAWGVTDQAGAGSGSGAGAPSFSTLTFTTDSGLASPALMLDTAQGTHLASAVLTVRVDGTVIETVDLGTPLLAAYHMSGSNAGVPVDSGSLVFSKIKVVNHAGDSATWSPLQPSQSGWDITTTKTQ